MKRLELSGKKINKLTVIGYSHSHIQPSGQKRAIWDVVCDCGISKKMSTGTLMHGSTISCGCEVKKKLINGINKKEKGLANLNYKFLSYRARAKRSRIEFKLTKEQFKSIVDNNCNYCGSPPSMRHVSRSFNGIYLSNGIDRVNSNNGYVMENCVACCRACNIMKNDYSVEYFLNHIRKIIVYVEKRQLSKDHLKKYSYRGEGG